MRTFLVAVPLLAIAPSARPAQEEPVHAPAPVITVAGQSFATWEEYTGSQLFRSLQLRCGTRADGGAAELRPASDCSLSATVIKPDYEPIGHPRYLIPVVVHILQSTTGQGQISDAMVASQIDVLNEDFQALTGTLGENGNDARIEFFLATEDPSGNPTSGITRTTNNSWFGDSQSPPTYWDALAWDTTRYLNIYTNQAGGNLGYVPALPQGGIVGSTVDRVVILWSAFGRNAPIGPPYHLGRTATHEVGHFMGLFHTFDGGCGSASCYTTGDRICDTNREAQPVFGCPGSSISCAGGLQDPYHNYMDYSDDDCYQEFTPEQNNRMRCTLENWRVDLPIPETCAIQATNAWRNAGPNLDVYTATPAVLGGTLTLTVTDATHNFAVVGGYAAPRQVTFPNGSVQLVNPASGEIFRVVLALPNGQASFQMPNDISLCGLTAYSQAVLRGQTPNTRSNAIDMTAGF